MSKEADNQKENFAKQIVMDMEKGLSVLKAMKRLKQFTTTCKKAGFEDSEIIEIYKYIALYIFVTDGKIADDGFLDKMGGQ